LVQRKPLQPGAGVFRLKKYQAFAHRVTWPSLAEIRWKARHHWCRTPRHYSASLVVTRLDQQPTACSTSSRTYRGGLRHLTSVSHRIHLSSAGKDDGDLSGLD